MSFARIFNSRILILTSAFLFTISTNAASPTVKTSKRELNMEWEAIPGSAGYELEFTRILSGEGEKKPVYFKAKGTTWNGEIQPGQYRVRIRSFDDRGSPGDWGKPFNYVVRSPAPELKRTGSTAAQKFEWPAGAESYEIEVAIKTDGRWKVWETKSNYRSNDLILDPAFPGGDGRLSITAVSETGEKSEPAIVEFYANPPAPTPAPATPNRAEVKREKDGMDDTVSVVLQSADAEYFGKFEDLGDATLKFNGDVGGFRLGWTHIRSSDDWGWTAIGDYSSIKVNGQGYNYGSLEAGAVWRKSLGSDFQLRVKMGAAYQELPHVKGRTLAAAKVENISAAGPFGDAQLWYPASRLFGLRANMQVTNLAVGLNMPSGQELKSGYEFQLGVAAFCNVHERATLVFGLSSRSESIAYTSTDGEGVNTVELEGSYLNAQLDWRW